MPKSEIGKLGCGCLSLVVLVFIGLPLARFGLEYSGRVLDRAKARYDARIENFRRERQSAVEHERAEKEAEIVRVNQALKEKADAERETRLRTFVLRDAPALWKEYVDLESQIRMQNRKIDDLRKVLADFDKDPKQDADFKVICAMRDEMVGVKVSLRKKMEDAYLAYRKFEATPSSKEYNELHRKILEDGMKEADSAARRYTNMRREK